MQTAALHHARVDTIAQHVFNQDRVLVCSAGGMSMVRERFAIAQQLWKVRVYNLREVIVWRLDFFMMQTMY